MRLSIFKTVIFEGLTRFFTLAVVLLVSRNFSVATYGYFTLFITITSIGQTVIDFGSQNFGVKELIKLKDITDIKTLVRTVSTFRFIGFVLWVVFSIVYSLFIEDAFSFAVLLIVWGLIYLYYCDWILKGVGKISSQALINMITNGLGVLVLYVLILNKSHLSTDALITLGKIAPLLASGIISILVLRSMTKTNLVFQPVQKTWPKAHFKETMLFTTGSFCARAYNSIGLILVGFLTDKVTLGLISYAFTFYNIFSMGRSILITSVYPYFCKLERHKALKLAMYLNLFATACFVIFLIIYLNFSDQIIHIIVPSENVISEITRFNFNVGVALIGTVCMSFFTITFLQAFEGGAIFNRLTIYGLIIVVVLNLLSYAFGYLAYSSILSLLVAELLISICSYYHIFKKKSIENISQ
ncbi:RfbX protein [Pedobacter sp. BAL39]|uniref:RfbX protein n=1 Tax=Pedobacter sp. BAL39 TaxID=391596 RepID=UPI0001559367|nr:RfbX protein [Pedobacter sp. BAL39]EDM34777.1 RfbX protein [Pedobacter sp. BAL39]